MSTLQRKSEPAQETTLEGQVEVLGDFPRGIFVDGRTIRYSGLFLKTDSGRVIIQLGPLGFFIKNHFQIKAGDTLMVTGKRVERDQVLLLQAREVRNHQRRLRLRDLHGRPLW